MPDTTPPARGTARTRLLAAAAELFYDEGINTTGVEALAAKAGVTKATLYNNFRSKDELVVAYLRAKLEATRASLAAHDPSGATPAKRVAIIFDTLATDIEAGRFDGCPFAKAAVEVPGNRAAMAVVREHHDAVVAHLTDITADADVAETIAMIYDGAIIAAKATGTADPVVHAGHAAARLLAA
ncbi:TetR/AcrR family transcriptional regulator [Microbacterium sp. SSW1-59]|uniref:TetR/AcrR family transcriptional regulator n=1 Tax=Microbacterium xanthum TaxID=3079794 RepID=UPI002AD53BE0|nr:TetR/AcrR family transcriptional regulator [Microbacterium sp. SSW1-59]MDZ8200241.1 TetR/AcrR family transcriptional regulator [Microbacterium sp. SSW1-59]